MAALTLRADAFSSVSRIVESARHIFSSGDGSETLSRIAQDAGVGIATLYRHFPNRGALARAVYGRILTAEVEPLFATFEKSSSPRKVLLDVAERLTEVLHNETWLAPSIGNLAEVTTEFLRRGSAMFEPAVIRAQQAGSLRSDIDAADIPNILAMISTGLGVIRADKAVRRRYLSLLLDALNPPQAVPLPR